jgi:hypothetical protein
MEMFSKKTGVLNLILRDSDSGLQQNTEDTSCAKSGVGLTALWRGATPPLFWSHFHTRNDQFTTTGSGQTHIRKR